MANKDNTANGQIEDVMGFLNEVQLNYPDAISLASGRPDERFFDLHNFQKYIDVFVDYMSKEKNTSAERILKDLGQYNRTKGVINTLMAKYLENDYQIKANADDLLINVGSQESFILTLLTLCDKENDVLIVEDPSYVGISHFSILAQYQVVPSPVGSSGLCLEKLEKNILQCQAKGQHVKLVYVIPDFQNPTGTRMPLENRKKLLQLAKQYGFYIVEDNAYGDFVFEGEKLPTIKSLDKNGHVIYLHSFSKIICPALRIGVMVCDQIDNEGHKLSDLMAKTKGYTTVNTPSITQMIVGGMLIEHQFSFDRYNEEKIKKLKVKRDRILKALHTYFRADESSDLAKITWNVPEGGYFMSLTLPIDIDKNDVIDCAKHYKVIATPMSFFHLTNEGGNQIRIAYSYVGEDLIDTAIERLSRFLHKKLNRNSAGVTSKKYEQLNNIT